MKTFFFFYLLKCYIVNLFSCVCVYVLKILASSSFFTLCKIHHKTLMHTPVGLNVGTLEGLIKADLSTSVAPIIGSIIGIGPILATSRLIGFN